MELPVVAGRIRLPAGCLFSRAESPPNYELHVFVAAEVGRLLGK